MTATADATDSSTVDQIIATVNDLTTTVKNLKTTIEQQANQIAELEQELAEQKDHTGREHADIRRRVTQTEEAVESLESHAMEGGSVGAAPGDEADETGSQNTEIPLERITALPEHVADRELTANQKRARFIACDIQDYAEKAPAGLVIDSRTIKKVIAAAEGARPHTQTVARVMDFLDRLGKNDIQLKKRRGKKLVVVDPKAADRYHDRCDRESGPTQPEHVISTG